MKKRDSRRPDGHSKRNRLAAEPPVQRGNGFGNDPADGASPPGMDSRHDSTDRIVKQLAQSGIPANSDLVFDIELIKVGE